MYDEGWFVDVHMRCLIRLISGVILVVPDCAIVITRYI